MTEIWSLFGFAIPGGVRQYRRCSGMTARTSSAVYPQSCDMAKSQPVWPSARGPRTPAQYREIQIIFQNPDSSLNPRHTVGHLIGRAVALFRDDVSGSAGADVIAEALREVQLDPVRDWPIHVDFQRIRSAICLFTR